MERRRPGDRGCRKLFEHISFQSKDFFLIFFYRPNKYIYQGYLLKLLLIEGICLEDVQSSNKHLCYGFWSIDLCDLQHQLNLRYHSELDIIRFGPFPGPGLFP